MKAWYVSKGGSFIERDHIYWNEIWHEDGESRNTTLSPIYGFVSKPLGKGPGDRPFVENLKAMTLIMIAIPTK